MIPASTGPRPAHRSLNQGQASTDADEPRRAPTSSRRWHDPLVPSARGRGPLRSVRETRGWRGSRSLRGGP
jgi:hypothetical protein